jgi:LysR family transcriptional activator of nhaA
MRELNYNHLLYFWTVAREGGLGAAGKVLHLSHPTLSAQIRTLEQRLGQKLFTRVGRRLVLTETGRLVYRYADEMFSLGRELLDSVRGVSTGRLVTFDVGVADAVPKLIVRELLGPALRTDQEVKLVCHEGKYERLLSELSTHHLDVVIADAPVPAGLHIRAFNHLLGECGTGLFAAPALARRHRSNFPMSLNGAPMLLPLQHSTLRRSLQQWLDAQGLAPRIVAEFEDSALLKVFGADGLGVFPAPLAVADEVCRQYGVQLIARIDAVKERFFAISVERRLKHPAVVAITASARNHLFAGG